MTTLMRALSVLKKFRLRRTSTSVILFPEKIFSLRRSSTLEICRACGALILDTDIRKQFRSIVAGTDLPSKLFCHSAPCYVLYSNNNTRTHNCRVSPIITLYHDPPLHPTHLRRPTTLCCPHTFALAKHEGHPSCSSGAAGTRIVSGS